MSGHTLASLFPYLVSRHNYEFQSRVRLKLVMDYDVVLFLGALGSVFGAPLIPAFDPGGI